VTTRADRRPAPPAGLAAHRLWSVVAFALLIRLAYVFSIHDAAFFTSLLTEPERYDGWAEMILQGTPPAPPYDEPPGFAYFVAATYAIFGRHVLAVVLVQAVLGALGCGLVAVLGARWFGPAVGVLAGVVAAVYAPFIYYAGRLEPPTVFVFFVLLAIWGSLARSPDQPRWMFVGGLWALAMLVRVEVVFGFPVVAFDALRRGGRGALVRIAAPIVLVVAIVATINVRVGHQSVLFTSAPGLMLWLGNDVDADGVSPFLSPARERVAREIGERAGDAAAADAMFRRRVVRFWLEQPRRAAQLLWKKFLWTWNDRELSNTTDTKWEVAQSWLLHHFHVGLGMVLPLALAGALLLGREWREVPLLAVPLAVTLVAPVVIFTNGRLRLLGAVSLAILAALALRRLPTLLRAPREHASALGRAAIGIGVGIALGWSNPYAIASYEIAELTVNRAVLERASGDLAGAVADLRHALGLDPTDTVAWLNLALAEEQRGDDVAALGAYLDGLAHVPPACPAISYFDALSEDAEGGALRAAAGALLRRRGADPGLLHAFVQATGDDRQTVRAEMVRRIARP
jgi:4-amino-4-deoxy-L-arabinose transferase-like glycosyltransferase